MSDYLWDKSGEADPEVERLEQSLGRLRYRPDALGLPPAAGMPAAAHGPRVAARFLRRAALAAAALALAALVGVLLVLRDAGRRETPTASAEAAPAAAGGTQTHSPARPLEPERAIVSAGGGHATPSVVSTEPRANNPAGGARSERRRFRPAKGTVSESPVRAAAGRGGAGRAEAKEQLLYALRLASVKLGEVRRMTAGRESDGEARGPRGLTR